MKISELIKLLSYVKELRGDVNVRLDLADGWTDIAEVTYHEYFVLNNLEKTYPFVVIEG